jgi:diguanylate cyclase (GGDEF)-like protein
MGPIEVPGFNGGTRLVFPVESNAGPLRLICLDGAAIEPEERVLLMHLVTLYRNQVNVLDSKERDSLTGLLNRQTFNLRLMQVTELRRMRGGDAWLAALDIDHFKRVNHTYGHLYGDEVLLQLSQLMQRHFRYTDFLFRFGGEEFIVLLTQASAAGAAQALERFRAGVEQHSFPAVGRVTLSIGFTRVEGGLLPTGLVDRADRALYRAKDGGRNRVVAFTDQGGPTDTGLAPDIELF